MPKYRQVPAPEPGAPLSREQVLVVREHLQNFLAAKAAIKAAAGPNAAKKFTRNLSIEELKALQKKYSTKAKELADLAKAGRRAIRGQSK